MNSYYRDLFRTSVLHMKRSILPVIALLVAALGTPVALADSDEPPLIVAGNGSDTGNCQETGAPCRTIGYALRKVGKNGQIKVGGGSYELSDVADVVYLLSGAIDVRGSYTEGSRSTLVGVAPEFAAQLETKGFNVIVDTKGTYREIVATQASLKSNAAATVCAGGFAGNFPCNNVDLLAHIADRTGTARGADIWGFMDLNTHREYVIIGYSIGTAVYDVSNAEQPIEVGFIDGQTTTWRDIKIHQFWNASTARWNAYAYITADNASDGLFIIDLSQLPHRIARLAYASDFTEAHNVYLTDTDFSTGLSITGDAPMLILAGSERSDGRFRIYSLANPAVPAFVAAPATPPGQPGGDRLYMHDAASMIVTDARKDTQCVNAGSSDHCDVLFDFNESTVDIWDITVPSNPQRLSQTPYSNSRYTHSGWWSEDQQTIFVQDELDERDRGLVTTLRAFSIANLTAPSFLGTWTGPTNAIDHNGFVRGNRYYMSNYSRGLSILDITDAASPSLVGRFDTYPSSDGVGFPGNWGTYPYLPSGNIALSDIDSGLYMVADNTLDVAQGSLSFTTTAFGGNETQAINLTVQRAGSAQGAVSVAWAVIGATADDNDVTNTNGTLNWGDGDAGDRTIALGLNDDGVAEDLERVLIKLSAPTGGASLSPPSIASAYISDPGATTSVGFQDSRIEISERGFGTAVAVVHRSGTATGPLSVDYAITAGSASAGADYSGPASGTLSWGDGDANPRWIEYAIVDDGSGEADEFLEITLSNQSIGGIAANASLRIDILDGVGSNSAPNSVAGISQTVASGATVTLNGAASNDPEGDSLTYAWSQSMGPTVTLANADTSTANFTAPTVSSDTLLRFDLQVSDPGGLSDTATASVTVSAGSTGGGGGGGGTTGLWMLAGLLAFAAFTRRGDV